MKKIVLFITVLLAAILVITACTGKPEQSAAGTTASTTVPATAPTISSTIPVTAPTTVPTTAPTQSTTAPATTPTTEPTTASTTEITQATVERPYLNPDYGFFKYVPGQQYLSKEADLSNCKAGYLYIYYKKTGCVEVVFDGAVIDTEIHNKHIFFVTAAEPTKLYSAPVSNYTEHTVVYESKHGPIVDLVLPDTELYDKGMTILEDNKRFVYLDLTTMKAEVLLEKPYIRLIYIDSVKKDNTKPAQDWRDFSRIYFEGKLTEDGEIKQYLYFWETGDIEENFRK